jgi:RNA recognition motif-containing protein
LFERFGRVVRCHLVTKEDGGKGGDGKVSRVPDGRAFLIFERREDAEVAVKSMNGHVYDHRVLRVEWTKPPREKSMTSNFASVHGKKLVSDTSDRKAI